MNETTFKINGFHCEACVKLSTLKIKKISYVTEVTIQPDGASKVCASRVIARDEISEALDGLGYTVTSI
ncbi:MAG: heavy-metal-associated domain-containing protein [Candidatus Moranbacteria bacterium]|nr:heavy-metal-associated domain-containing protein [Candidatus Moranbacteria bacterium]